MIKINNIKVLSSGPGHFQLIINSIKESKYTMNMIIFLLIQIQNYIKKSRYKLYKREILFKLKKKIINFDKYSKT